MFYAQGRYVGVGMPSVIILSVIMLNIVICHYLYSECCYDVTMLTVIMLNVVAPIRMILRHVYEVFRLLSLTHIQRSYYNQNKFMYFLQKNSYDNLTITLKLVVS